MKLICLEILFFVFKLEEIVWSVGNVLGKYRLDCCIGLENGYNNS